MTQTFAYQIGAVFLLAALLMGSTFTRGIFPEFFKSAKVLVLIAGALLLALAGYRLIPDLYHRLFPAPASAAVPIQAAPAPRKTSAPSRPKATVTEVEYTLKVQTKNAPAPLESANSAEPAPAPAIAKVEATPDESAQPLPPAQEGRGKRVLKSIGRALHISHRKYEPPSNGAQP